MGQLINAYNTFMNTTAESVMATAMQLPPLLRAFVAERLIESLDVSVPPSLTSKWKREVRRRCEDVDRGSVILREAETVFEKARSSLA